MRRAAAQSRRAPQGARGLKFIKDLEDGFLLARRAPQGARGLKSIPDGEFALNHGRAPQGARGLK